MSTTPDNAPELYQGEWVWDAEIVDDIPSPTAPDPGTAGPDPRTPDSESGIRNPGRSHRVVQAVWTGIRIVGTRTGPGYRNAFQVTAHWLSGQNMSDEEIRRRVVFRALALYRKQRADAAAALAAAEKPVAAWAARAARQGLTAQEKTLAAQAGEKARRHRAAVEHLTAESFIAVWPTNDEVARARRTGGAGRFVTALVGLGVGGFAVIQFPVSALLAIPLSLAGAWWLTRHPIPLTERSLPPVLQIPELETAMPAGLHGQQPHPTGLTPTYDPNTVTPETEEFTRALYGARLLKPPKSEDGQPVIYPHATIVGEVVRDQLGWQAFIVLPAGQDLNADKIINRRVDIAGEMAVDESLLLLERVRPEAGGHARMVKVARFHVDPMTISYRSPLIGRTEPLDVWNDGAPVASDPRGEIIAILIRDIAIILGGASRSGKGVALAALICACALDPRVNLRIIDGKGSGEHNRTARIASTFFKHSPERLLALLLVFKDEMDRRYARLSDLGRSKLDEDLLHEMPIEVIAIDELYPYTTHPKLRAKIIRLLILLGSQGLGAGIILVLTTQTPLVEVIPRLLRNNIAGRWAMRCEDATSSNTILGDGRAGAGFNASLISDETRGVGWLALGGKPALRRSHYLTDQEVADIITNAFELRRLAGVLPGQCFDPIEDALYSLTGLSTVAGGQGGRGSAEGGTYNTDAYDADADGFDPDADPEEEEDPAHLDQLLTTIADLFEGEAKAHLADIAARLNKDGTQGTDWTSSTVGDALRAAGLEVKPVRAGMTSKSGKGIDLTALRDLAEPE
ncbi:FtsK/SpoIIIE domain-containing protein (plasmid) [Streptomyces sp. NBC_01298]|uniref:FtsK/SpoIIIE domain-containing protein n=1 Tax=Streptomyces sp. NBC_01298 TaxID=2903817 RepID=UPI002E0DC6C0|nr:FtsK/SpoIIIE domain-containing protein [Streptomyces sp. NBC_01298]